MNNICIPEYGNSPHNPEVAGSNPVSAILSMYAYVYGNTVDMGVFLFSRKYGNEIKTDGKHFRMPKTCFRIAEGFGKRSVSAEHLFPPVFLFIYRLICVMQFSHVPASALLSGTAMQRVLLLSLPRWYPRRVPQGTPPYPSVP